MKSWKLNDNSDTFASESFLSLGKIRGVVSNTPNGCIFENYAKMEYLFRGVQGFALAIRERSNPM